MKEQPSQCPKCSSSELEPVKKSAFDGATTSKCKGCGLVVRPARRRSTLVFVLVLGSIFGFGGAALFIATAARAIDWGESPPIHLFVGFMALGFSCGIWAVIQLVRKR